VVAAGVQVQAGAGRFLVYLTSPISLMPLININVQEKKVTIPFHLHGDLDVQLHYLATRGNFPVSLVHEADH
jgi:hypothetical protein